LNNQAEIPSYRLYGEEDSASIADKVHCERISERSRLHNWHILPHKHSRLFQLLWIKRGLANVNLDGDIFDMREGQIISIPPGFIHGFDFSTSTEGFVVTIDIELVEHILGRLHEYPTFKTQFVWYKNPEQRQTLYKLFECLYEAFNESMPGRMTAITILAEALIIAWNDENHQQDSADISKRNRAENHYLRFEKLVNQHYDAQKTVSWYADQLGVTPEHLNVISKQMAGISALAVIHQRLIIEAKRLLVFTVLNVEQVSETLGFKDPAYFSRFFKAKTGVPPRNFAE
jgi:AraC family transcriptional activator of pobA